MLTLNFRSVLLSLGLAMSIAPQVTLAGHWSIFATGNLNCSTANGDGYDWKWSGKNTICHNFDAATKRDNCTLEIYSDGTPSSKPCYEEPSGGPYGARTLYYQNKQDNSGIGCDFFYDNDCEGTPMRITEANLTNNCYEFSPVVASFRCPKQ